MENKNLAVRIAVIESEKGWGRKVADYMVCLSIQDAMEFKKEFNYKNRETCTPDWYMMVEGEPELIELTDTQFSKLKEDNRVCLLILNEY